MTDTRSTPQDDELPGMLAVAKGVAEQRFPHTMDAAVWAAEFVKLNPGADEGLMLSWFANAIMAGYDTARYTRSENAPIDQGTEKILRDLLDRIYKMNLMAIPALRVTEQDQDSNDPLVAWMSDVRSVLYGGTKPVPDVIRDLQGPKP